MYYLRLAKITRTPQRMVMDMESLGVVSWWHLTKTMLFRYREA